LRPGARRHRHHTQPDFSMVGKLRDADKTVRTGNWIRTDSVFIENTQIESLSNRPPWIGPRSWKRRCTKRGPGLPPPADGISATEQTLRHVIDMGANYCSLWNFHRISAASLANLYKVCPQVFDDLNRRAGYNVRPVLYLGVGRAGSRRHHRGVSQRRHCRSSRRAVRVSCQPGRQGAG